jgi:hypothetical protein
MSVAALPLPARTPLPARRPGRRAHLRVVPSRRTRRRRRTMALLVGAAVASLLTVVGFHVVLAEHQLALERLEQRTDASERRYQEARLGHAALSSPNRIVDRAAQLGLVAPGPPTAIVVSGEPLPEPDAPATTLHGWTEVKPTLGSGP